MHYKMLPVITDWLPADKEMEAFINQMRQTKYDEKIVESRRSDAFFNKDRLGKTFEEILSRKLAIADRTLYRRGNFMGTWDQVLCNAAPRIRCRYRPVGRRALGTTTLEKTGSRWKT